MRKPMIHPRLVPMAPAPARKPSGPVVAERRFQGASGPVTIQVRQPAVAGEYPAKRRRHPRLKVYRCTASIRADGRLRHFDARGADALTALIHATRLAWNLLIRRGEPLKGEWGRFDAEERDYPLIIPAYLTADSQDRVMLFVERLSFTDMKKATRFGPKLGAKTKPSLQRRRPTGGG